MTRASALGVVAAVAATAAVVWLSHQPFSLSADDGAVVRVAFRARPERIETCVEQSPEVLAALPPHMRQSRLCEGTTASYQLEILRDGLVVDQLAVHGGGVRQDRPLYVFREVAVPHGEAVFEVRFTKQAAPGSARASSASSSLDEAREDLRQAVPAVLRFERRLALAPRAVFLVSYDPDRRELYVATPP